MTRAPNPKMQAKGDYVVRAPRNTDALGHALRGAYGDVGAGDFVALLNQLDRIAIH